ncbi:MAG TPA: hypothetical protein VF590_11820 [Isosphaeraceae bacterium]|jgi:hypothetical protein
MAGALGTVAGGMKPSQAEYEAKMKAKPEQLVRRKASALGFELVPMVAPGVT